MYDGDGDGDGGTLAAVVVERPPASKVEQHLWLDRALDGATSEATAEVCV